MLLRRGQDADFVKVLDFGLARIFDEQGDLAGTAISLSPLTKDGLVFGTPEYMSPEQACGGKVGPQSDVYALGAVLYEMATGSVPFSGPTFTDILSRHVRETPVPPAARCPQLGIAPELDRLILECMEKEPERRPPGARVLGERLAALAAELGRGAQRVAPETAASETAELRRRPREAGGGAHPRGGDARPDAGGRAGGARRGGGGTDGGGPRADGADDADAAQHPIGRPATHPDPGRRGRGAGGGDRGRRAAVGAGRGAGRARRRGHVFGARHAGRPGRSRG